MTSCPPSSGALRLVSVLSLVSGALVVVVPGSVLQFVLRIVPMTVDVSVAFLIFTEPASRSIE